VNAAIYLQVPVSMVFLYQLSDYQFLKKHSDLWTYLVVLLSFTLY
jgi:hypothetical protein